MTSASQFSSTGIHRVAQVASSPELVRIKYLDVAPPQDASTRGVILLIHGFPQTSYQFRKVITPFIDAGYRLIVPDYRGAGESAKPMNLDGYSKVHMASDLHTLIHDHLKITSSIHVVGHDIGGMIAHAYAASFPADVASICWGECPLPGTRFYEQVKGTVDVFHFNFHRVLDLPETLIRGNERAYLKFFFDKLIFNAAAITAEDLDYYTQQYAQPGGVRGGVNVYRMFEQDAEDNKKIRERDGKCKVRCMVLSGGESFLKNAAEEEASEFYETYATAEVEHSGHYIAEENPEGFVEEVLKFVEKR